MSGIYLDHNATTPPLPEVVSAVAQTLSDVWANASSGHAEGQKAKQLLMQARAQVARFLGCKPAEVVFTSGATEANHIALRGAPGFGGRRRLLVSQAEHAGVQKLVRHLALSADVPIDWMPLLPDGSLDMAATSALISEDTSLVSLMAANNETGVLMPIGEMARLAHAHGALLHVDATQLVGKLPFDMAQCGADLVSVSAHKFGGPKGIGALVVRQGLNWPALFQGSQERGRRGGTENLPAIVGFGLAAQAHTCTPAAWVARASQVAEMRDALEAGLAQRIPDVKVYGQGLARLPNTSFLRLGQVHADVVLQRLEQLGVMASSGAACSSSGNEPSAVLTAMGVPREEALCAVRFSLSSDNRIEDIRQLVDDLSDQLLPLMAAAQEAANPPISRSGAFA